MYANVGIKRNMILCYLLPNNLIVYKNINIHYRLAAFDDLVVHNNIKVTTQVCLYNWVMVH